MGSRHPATRSFSYAFKGIQAAFEREPNFRIHTAIAIAVLTVAAFLKFSLIEWLFLAFAIVFVIAMELLNTVLEAMVNLISPDVTPEAKVAKDVSAGMVLLAAILATIVGVVLFLPKILLLFA